MASGFSQFDFHPSIQQAIDKEGYTQPTPIQLQAIPVVATGVDVMGAAQTGTGKTAGFTLPILNKIISFASESTSPARHPVRALMLAPTRELADQIASKVAIYAEFTPLRSCVVYGGVDMAAQVAELRRGVEIVIATPGRLLDHLQQKTIQLNQVEILVLDEADRMLDMGFLPDLQRIINLLPASRQNLLFSATFSPEIQKLAKSFMLHPALIEVARSNSTAENIEQMLYCLPTNEDKFDAIYHLITQKKLSQVIVFSNTKLACSKIARQLERKGLTAVAIHGDKSQIERTKALDAFKAGQVVVLAATDVAARGLDIPNLPHVINYDLPTTAEDYVHRIGRTGRAGAKGTAYSLSTKGNDRVLKDIEKLIGQKIPSSELEGFQPKSVNPPKEKSSASREVDQNSRTQRRSEPRYNNRNPAKDSAISRDEEFERLRLKLSGLNSKDDIFSKPYEEKPDVESSTNENKSSVQDESGKARRLKSIPGSSNKENKEPVARLFSPPKSS